MIKEVNGKKYIFMHHPTPKSYACPKCAAWNDKEQCEVLHWDCDGGYFSEADDQTPEVMVTNQQTPLTHDQIEAIGKLILDRGFHEWEGLQPWVHTFVKAVEAAHGIQK